MRSTLLVGSIIASAMIVGCAPKKPPEPISPTPSADVIGAMRENYKKAFPNSQVGTIVAVLSDEDYASIGEVDVKKFAEGDVVQIIDGNEAVIAKGQVSHVGDTTIAVKFTVTGPRRPATGDVAVRF